MESILKIIIVILVLITANLLAEDYLDLNFFIEPQFEHNEINMVNLLIDSNENDSIPQINIFAGRLLQKPQSDSLMVHLLNTLQPQIVSPIDYLFRDKNLQIELLISNIESDSIVIVKHKIIVADSFRVGMFSIYTPDFVVKNNIEASFDFDIFQIAKQQSEILKKETDFVIMLSNVSKYIDKNIVKNIPVDAVVSFDYQKKRNEMLNHKTMFYSILSKKDKFGKLRLTFNKGKINQKWKSIEFDAK